VVVVHAADERHAAAAGAAAERFRAGGWRADVVPVGRDRLDGEAVAALRARGAGWVLFLGDDAGLTALLGQASALGWVPQVLASGALSPRAGLSAPEAFQGRITLAMPSAPEDESPAGREALERAARRAGSGARFHSVRASAWGAAQVLAEGLRRAGRGLSRERLAASLEALYLFETGVLPPISYGPSRRIGAAGAWLVTVDPSARGFRPLAGWTPVD
jgi:ABC-type branched-subunit amino acid transport system substrate-binding protein